MRRSGFAVCLFPLLVWCSACGPAQQGAAPAAAIQGTVTLDGTPIPTGEIHFGFVGIPPRVLEINKGAFAGEAPVGQNLVEVFIYVEGPPSEKYGGSRPKTNTIPQKYWGPNTTLSATVTAGAANDFTFKLTSK